MSLTLADAFVKFLGAVNIAYLARILGPADFGKMNFAQAIVGYFAILAQFGLNTIGVRQVARDKSTTRTYIKHIVSLKVFLGSAAFCLLLGAVFFMDKPPQMKALIISYGVTIFTASVFLLDWVFQGIEKMEYLGVSVVIQSLFYFLLLMAFVKTPLDLGHVPWVLVASQVAAAGFLGLVLLREFPDMAAAARRRALALKPEYNPVFSRDLIAQALPIGLTGVCSIVIYNTGPVMLGFMRSDLDVGYFSAAQKVVMILVGAGAAFYTSIFPSISYHYRQSSGENFQKLVRYTFRIMVTLTLPALTGIAMLAHPIVRLLYGTKFLDAAGILQLLTLNAFLVYVNSIYSQILWAADRQSRVFRIVAMQAAAVVALNFLLILYAGRTGVAVVAVLGEMFAFVFYRSEVKKIVDIGVRRYFAKPALASMLMAGALLLVPEINLFFRVLIGAAVYAAAMFLVKGVNRADLDLVLGAARGKQHV